MGRDSELFKAAKTGNNAVLERVFASYLRRANPQASGGGGGGGTGSGGGHFGRLVWSLLPPTLSLFFSLSFSLSLFLSLSLQLSTGASDSGLLTII
jgi:hypothetical protein